MKKKLLFTSVFLMTLNIVTKILGLFKETVIAYYYGSGPVTDSFALIQNIAAVAFCTVTSCIVISYITNMTNVEEKNDTLNSLLNIVTIMFFICSIFIIIFAEQIIKLLAPGFNSETVLLCTNMLRIAIPFCIGYGYLFIIQADLQTKNVFWFLGLTQFIADIVLILFIVLSKKNVYLLSVGYGISIFAQILFVYLIDKKHKFLYQLKIKKNNTRLKMIFKVAFPIFWSELFINGITLIDKFFASNIGVGILANLNYATKVSNLFISFFISVISIVLLPTLVKQTNNLNKYRSISEQIINYIIIITVPLAFFLVIFSEKIIRVLFFRGAFDLDSLLCTSNLLIIYSIAVPALSLNAILKNQLYAFNDSKKISSCVILSLIINVVLDYILSILFGYYGIAIASVISSWFLFIVLLILLVKKINGINFKRLFLCFIKSLFSSLVMGIIVVLIMKNCQMNDIILLGLSAIIGIVVYLIMLYILREQDFTSLLNDIFRKLFYKCKLKFFSNGRK